MRGVVRITLRPGYAKDDPHQSVSAGNRCCPTPPGFLSLFCLCRASHIPAHPPTHGCHSACTLVRSAICTPQLHQVVCTCYSLNEHAVNLRERCILLPHHNMNPTPNITGAHLNNRFQDQYTNPPSSLRRPPRKQATQRRVSQRISPVTL